MSSDSKQPEYPRHIAIVMDGNGRWARRRGLPRNSGHRAGVRAARKVVEACGQRDIEMLTLFAFSSENWNRPPREVSLLMRLFVEAIQREAQDLHTNNVRLRFIGDRAMLPANLTRQMAASEELTAGNTGLQLNIAVSYGGRWDILRATGRIAARIAAGEIDADSLDEATLAAELSLGTARDPDLFIRTGGEKRVSNFLLWNLAYSEFYFSDALWPDFDAVLLDRAIDSYSERQRRFGRTAEQLSAS
ncbi:MAG: di-trans,poly-cis-decaprenylcistransferase [Gammaproteobacteria bacterium]|nr:di-trans,poly-cis-decaprenylcistransferase [Gammaproteobacteria bacterium]NNF59832.1 di-trans,poly-cis-decaprenylcistransferase [Gammaproteobacteria bacterium]NNM21294.1 di-trans,poly-cis-decaprenylcistransferase [Gammaproteobacteria bacterium]